ncbi:DNA polymerase I [Lacrimispora sp.]|uniref:DNA polymerase I n=1 Tax=Lacrimispora sp. TaxID=2719234 RepID=UPI0032E4589A
MNRKKTVLIDGTSMLKEVYYAVPANCVKGIRNVVVRIIEEKQTDYIAAVFGSINENGIAARDLMENETKLKETLSSLKIPVFEKEGARSLDLICSLAKNCESDEKDVSILTADENFLMMVSQHITAWIPGVGEEGAELINWTAEKVKKEFGLEPEQLKEVFSLERGAGIGRKTACRLVSQYGSLQAIYGKKEELESDQIREALSKYEQQISKEAQILCLKADYDVHLDEVKSIAESEIAEIMDMDFEPASFPEEVEEISSDGWMGKAITELVDAEEIFSRCAAGMSVGMQVAGTDKKITALALCLSKEACWCLIAQGDLTSEYLKEKAEDMISHSETITVLDLKSQLPFLNVSDEKTVFDASLAAYLIDPLKSSYEYNELAQDYLQLSLPSKTELLGKRTIIQALSENQTQAVTCMCSMAYVSFMCGSVLKEGLQTTEMDRLFYEIEMPLVYSLFTMEETGIRVERDRLKEYGDRLKVRIKETELKIYEQTGETFNINSPKQLGEILFEKMKLPGGKKTKTGYSTAADVLEKLAPDYPVIEQILDYRQLTKLNSTYADGLAAYIGTDERIHGTFNQTITATGRISSTEPNLQNIPIRMELGREIRKVFVPQEGCVFVDADYSQIELRVLAHMSGDERLISAYQQAEDIHAITASEVFHVPLPEVTSLQRRNAKAVNFGIVYGISSFGLSEGLSITRKEATEYIEKYFETYPGVKLFLDKLVADAKETGFAVSMFGRRRPVPELKSSNFMQRSFGERVAMNSPIQGTAADIMKIAMIRVDRALKKQGLQSKIVLQVHDELLIETRLEELDQVKKLLVEEMKSAASLAVPLEVDANVGESWFDAK